MSASVTDAHRNAVAAIRKEEDEAWVLSHEQAAQLVADSEERAVEAIASERDIYQREAYHLRKDLCEIAAAFGIGVPDSEEAKKRIIAVKTERDQLRAECERLTRSEKEARRSETDARLMLDIYAGIEHRAERAEAELAPSGRYIKNCSIK